MSDIPAFFPTLFCKDACDEQDLAALTRLASPYRLNAAQTIFSEGELAETAFGLSRGLVRRYKRLPDGRRRVVSFALPGDFLDIPLTERFGLSVDTVGEASICRFSRQQLKRVALASTNLMRLLMEFATRELRMTQDQLALLGNGSAEERLITFLVNWRSRLGLPSTGSQPVPLPMRRQDIADFLGLQLETISRTLARLENKRIIRILPNAVLLNGLEQVPSAGEEDQ